MISCKQLEGIYEILHESTFKSLVKSVIDIVDDGNNVALKVNNELFNFLYKKSESTNQTSINTFPTEYKVKLDLLHLALNEGRIEETDYIRHSVKIYNLLAAELSVLVRITASAARLFSIEERDVALDFVHIYYFIKRFDKHDKIESIKPLNEESTLKKIYTIVLNEVTSKFRIASIKKSLEGILSGDEYSLYVKYEEILNEMWVNGIKKYDLNIVKKARDIMRIDRGTNRIEWSKMVKVDQNKYKRVVTICFINKYFNIHVKSLAQFLLYCDQKNDQIPLNRNEFPKLTLPQLNLEKGESLEPLLEATFIYYYKVTFNNENSKVMFFKSWSEREVFFKRKTTIIVESDKNTESRYDLAVDFLNSIIANEVIIAEDVSERYEKLFRSVRNNDVDALESVADSDDLFKTVQSSCGFTLLHWACYKGHTDLVEYMLGKDNFPEAIWTLKDKTYVPASEKDKYITLKTPIKDQDNPDWSPLMWASVMDHADIVDLLLEPNRIGKVLDKENYVLLHRLSNLRRFNILHKVIKPSDSPRSPSTTNNNSNQDKKNLNDQLNVIDSDQRTILHHCVHRPSEDIETLEFLLSAFTKILSPEAKSKALRQIDRNLCSALYIAVYNGCLQQVDKLRQHTPDLVWNLYETENGESTLITIAAIRGHSLVLKNLLQGVDDMNYHTNVLTSFKILAEGKRRLKASVVWELCMYRSGNIYELRGYQSRILSKLDAVDIREIYREHFTKIVPYKVTSLEKTFKLRKNEYFIDLTVDCYPDDSITTKVTVEKSKIFSNYMDKFIHTISHVGIEKMKVSAFSFSLPDTSTIDFLNRWVLELYKYIDLDIFELEFIKVSIRCAWKRFGYRVHIAELFLYAVYLVFFSVINYVYSQENDFGMAVYLTAITGFYLLLFVVKTVETWFQSNFVAYFTTYHTYTEVLSYIFTLVASGYRLSLHSESDISSILMAISTILIYSRILYYLQPFEATGPLVGMIEAIVWRIKTFLFILLIVNISFALAMYLLSWKYDPDGENFGIWYISLVRAYQYMSGQSEFAPSGTFNSSLANFLVVIFYLISTIILLNLLISIMSSVHGEVSVQASAEWHRQTCKTLMIQPTWIRNLLCKIDNRPNFIYIKRNLDHVDGILTTSEREINNNSLYGNVDISQMLYDPTDKLDKDFKFRVNPSENGNIYIDSGDLNDEDNFEGNDPSVKSGHTKTSPKKSSLSPKSLNDKGTKSTSNRKSSLIANSPESRHISSNYISLAIDNEEPKRKEDEIEVIREFPSCPMGPMTNTDIYQNILPSPTLGISSVRSSEFSIDSSSIHPFQESQL